MLARRGPALFGEVTMTHIPGAFARYLTKGLGGRLTGVAVLAVTLSLASSPAVAQANRITRGDAESVLRAFGSGGRVVLFHARAGLSVETQGNGVSSGAEIRPFAGSPWDGAHYCVLDWHTVLISAADGGDKTFTRAQALVDYSTQHITLLVDGAAVASTTTAVSRWNLPELSGVAEAYYRNQGLLLAPGSLSVGTHTAGVAILDSVNGDFSDSITFTIDAAGTGACL